MQQRQSGKLTARNQQERSEENSKIWKELIRTEKMGMYKNFSLNHVLHQSIFLTGKKNNKNPYCNLSSDYANILNTLYQDNPTF